MRVVLCVSAGFDSDNISTDRTHREGCPQTADHIGVRHIAVKQQHLNQLTGAISVTVGLTRRSPERFMCIGERSTRPRLNQRGSSRQRAGLDFQDLQIVVEIQDLGALAGRAFVVSDSCSPVTRLLMRSMRCCGPIWMLRLSSAIRSPGS